MSNMKKLIAMLKRHEGVETHAYECSEGKITVGVGRNIDQRGGMGLSEDEVEYLLENDIERVIKELAKEYPWFNKLDDVRRDAMIDIALILVQLVYEVSNALYPRWNGKNTQKPLRSS